MAHTETEGFEVTLEDGFSRIALDNPPRNLLDPRIMAALRAAILDADADESAKAIVLTGSGDIFCGGLDLAQIQAGANPVDFAAGLVDLLRVLPGLGKPFIAAVNGDALASGYSLACAADIAIAVEGAKLGTLEATVGIWPMIAQVPALQRLQVRHAIENILTGEPFDAARAQEIGVVNRVVPVASLWDEVRRWVEMSTRAGAALPAGRRAFYRFADMSYDDALTASLDQFRRMFEGG
jgi:enoyl-CoA hydratase/carnithine racemase